MEGTAGEGEGRLCNRYSVLLSGEGRGERVDGVDPGSEQILFKYFLVRPKNIFVTRNFETLN